MLQALAKFCGGRLRSISYALAGITHLLRTQKNAQLHCVATLVVIAAGVILRLSPMEWCWIIAAVTGVWTAEAFNTALECICDATCPQHHPMIGKAKDVAAGSVLLAAIAAAGIGICVLLPHLGW